MLTQPASMTPYVYALNNPTLYTDPSGEVVPIAVIAGVGFAAGAIYNAYQQTSGFTNLCKFDVLQMLASGVGGAAATVSITLMAVSGVGLFGMGLQGVGFGASVLFGAGSFSTSLWLAGASAMGWSITTTAWLWAENSYPRLIIDSSKMPNIAKNIRNAQANGAPQVLTRTEDPALIAANRRAACSGFCGQGSPDEYPFASTYEGGKGAFVSGVSSREQNIQGGILNSFYRQFKIRDGDRFRVMVK